MVKEEVELRIGVVNRRLRELILTKLLKLKRPRKQRERKRI